MTPTRTCTRCLDRPAADGLGWCPTAADTEAGE